MNYAEYLEVTENSEFNPRIYRALLGDAATASPDRLQAILNMMMSISIPEDWAGTVEEVWESAVEEIQEGQYVEDMLVYARMCWLLLPSVNEALFHSIEQLS